MTRLSLVTGAGGQLGTDLLAVLAGRRTRWSAGAGAELDVTDPAAVRAGGGRRPGRTSCVNAAAYTAVDAAETDEATARTRSTPTAGRLAPGLRAAPAAGWCTSPPTTSSPATPRRRTTVDAPTGAALGVRADQAGRRAGGARAAAGAVLRRAHGVGVRRAPAATSSRRWRGWPASARPSTSSTTSTARRPGRATWPPGWSRWRSASPPPGIYHCTNAGAHDLVRPGPGGVRGARRRPGAGAADEHRRRSRGRRRGRPTRCCPTRPGGPPGCRRRDPGGTRCTPPSPRWAGHWGGSARSERRCGRLLPGHLG